MMATNKVKTQGTLLGMVDKVVDIKEDDIMCLTRVSRLPSEGWTKVSLLTSTIITIGLED